MNLHKGFTPHGGGGGGVWGGGGGKKDFYKKGELEIAKRVYPPWGGGGGRGKAAGRERVGVRGAARNLTKKRE